MALGFGRIAESGSSVAGAAYDYAAGGSDVWSRWLSWVCPACQATVIDHGPEAGNPEDQEQGHATDCPRLAGAVTAWNASWGAEDGQ
jgi:hypothetical protein